MLNSKRWFSFSYQLRIIKQNRISHFLLIIYTYPRLTISDKYTNPRLIFSVSYTYPRLSDSTDTHLSAIIGWCKYTHIRDYLQGKASFLIFLNLKRLARNRNFLRAFFCILCLELFISRHKQNEYVHTLYSTAVAP